MKAYHYDRDSGIYKGATVCQPSPLEKGKFLVPAFSVLQAPPNAPKGHAARWTGSAWEIVVEPTKPKQAPENLPPEGDIPIQGLTSKQKFEIQVEVKKHVKDWVDKEAQSVYSPLRQKILSEQKAQTPQPQPEQLSNPEPVKEE